MWLVSQPMWFRIFFPWHGTLVHISNSWEKEMCVFRHGQKYRESMRLPFFGTCNLNQPYKSTKTDKIFEILNVLKINLWFFENKLAFYKKHKKKSNSWINRTLHVYFIDYYFCCNIAFPLVCFSLFKFKKLLIEMFFT